MGDNILERDAKFTRSVIMAGLILSLIAAVIFLFNPDIDLIVGGLMFTNETGFVFNRFQSVNYIRKAIIFGYAFWYSGIVALLLFAIYELRISKIGGKRYGFLKLDLPQLSYLFFTALAGPLLVANIILKNNWGRARPRQIVEFGGSQDFGPPLLMSDQCETNCSFVSGEPASMFMIFFALAFVLPHHRKMLMAFGVCLGGLSGLMRMGQGGHFFSDVVFAGLFMAITAALIFWVMHLLPARRETR